MGDAVRQGLIVATGLGLPTMVAIWNLDLALMLTNQDPKVVELAQGYLHGLSGAVLPVLWFGVLRNFVAVLSQTVSILIISIIAVALNYLLTVWLVYGGLGLRHWACSVPGLHMTIVSWFMFLALILARVPQTHVSRLRPVSREMAHTLAAVQ